MAKMLRCLVLCFTGLSLVYGEKTEVPKGELNPTEKQFVGKWSGSRASYQWEIHRKMDRTFEIVFIEPDTFEGENFTYQNYATGVFGGLREKTTNSSGFIGGVMKAIFRDYVQSLLSSSKRIK